MFAWVKQFLAPPVFRDDEDKTRVASLLNTILIAFLMMSVIMMGIGLLSPVPNPIPGLVANGILILLELGALTLMRRGRVRLASGLVSSVLGLFFILLTLGSGGVFSPVFGSYTVVILIVGLLLGGSVGVGFAGLGVLAGLGMLYASIRGVLPPSLIPTTPVSTWAGLTANFIMTAVLLYLATRSLNDALRRARHYASELEEHKNHLEETVAERTRDLVDCGGELERRNLHLATAAEVSRAASSILDIEELLNRTVTLIVERFDLYYAGLFLVDEGGEWAVLHAGSGEAGQQMVSQGYKLGVGGASMVGWCMANAQARIASDVGAEAIRFDNPLLPDTRSEMALPLISRGRVIGALDVQSTEAMAFTNEDVTVLQTMADQLANAIENARLFRRVEDGVEEISRLHQRYLRQEWQKYLADEENRARVGYVYDQGNVRLAGDVRTPEIALAVDRGEAVAVSETEIPTSLQPDVAATDTALPRTPDAVAPSGFGQSALAVPLSLRGQVIGALGFYETEQPRRWTSDDIALVEAVADQVALAVENARAYAELQRTAEQLKEVDRLKSQFLANMSHELRTPLNSIIGFSRVLLKGIDGPITDLQRTDLTAIYNNGQHLLGLINDILDISKIAAGKMELVLEQQVDLKMIVKGVMSTAVGLVKGRPIKLVQDVPGNLPFVRGDSTRIRQVILNLVSNAAKFTEEGQIAVRARADERFVTISISDTGLGIPPQNQETIFEEFGQVDASSTRRVGGTGLGLPISRHFVEMHGGRIWVESTLGVGSTFRFTLPIMGPEIAEELKLPEPVDHNRKLILAVDDDPGVITLYKRYLEREGYQVIGVNKGEEALQYASRLTPYAILLDVLLPDRDGWEVMEELKTSRETRKIPIILCTIVSEKARGLSLGAIDYLQKPILESDLLRSLKELESRIQAS